MSDSLLEKEETLGKKIQYGLDKCVLNSCMSGVLTKTIIFTNFKHKYINPYWSFQSKKKINEKAKIILEKAKKEKGENLQIGKQKIRFSETEKGRQWSEMQRKRENA